MRNCQVFELTCKIWNDSLHFCVSDGTFSLFHHVFDEKDSPGWQLWLVSASVVCYLTGQFWLSAASWEEPWPAIFCRTRGFSQSCDATTPVIRHIRLLIGQRLSLFNILGPINSIKVEPKWNIKRCKQHFSCHKSYRVVRARYIDAEEVALARG